MNLFPNNFQHDRDSGKYLVSLLVPGRQICFPMIKQKKINNPNEVSNQIDFLMIYNRRKQLLYEKIDGSIGK